MKLLLAKKNKKKRVISDNDENADNAKKNKATSRWCGIYDKIEHNARTYQIKID